MKITIQPELGEVPALWRVLEPHLPPVFHAPDSVVLAIDGFRLRWKKGPVSLDVTATLMANESG